MIVVTSGITNDPNAIKLLHKFSYLFDSKHENSVCQVGASKAERKAVTKVASIW